MCCSFTNNYKHVKCYFVAIIVLLCVAINFVNPNRLNCITFATETDISENSQNLQDELTDNVYDTIADLDLTEIEQYFAENADIFYNLFGFSDYQEFLIALISGEILTDFNSVFSFILQGVKENLSTILSPLLLILVIVLISVVFKNIRPKVTSSGVAEAVFFICFAVVVSIVTMLVSNVINVVYQSISKMQSQMDGIFPILLLLMTTAGGTISVKAYQPLMLLLSNLISTVFIRILMPIVVVVFVLNMVGNISPKTKVKRLTEFFSSAFKWIISTIFTVYMTFMSVQGITASSADGWSIKTAKYAIKNYIPMLGGYISDGFEVAKVGANIIKNAVGFSGIIFVIITILSPVILIAVLELSLKLVAGLIEPLSDDRASALLSSTGKSLSMLKVIVVGVAIMYFVIIFLLMCSVSGVV